MCLLQMMSGLGVRPFSYSFKKSLEKRKAPSDLSDTSLKKQISCLFNVEFLSIVPKPSSPMRASLSNHFLLCQGASQNSHILVKRGSDVWILVPQLVVLFGQAYRVQPWWGSKPPRVGFEVLKATCHSQFTLPAVACCHVCGRLLWQTCIPLNC